MAFLRLMEDVYRVNLELQSLQGISEFSYRVVALLGHGYQGIFQTIVFKGRRSPGCSRTLLSGNCNHSY